MDVNLENKLNFEYLKEKKRSMREGFSENLGLRIHRAISWLERAEKETDDTDAAFIFYWIAFNAAYTEDTANPTYYNERGAYQEYFNKISSCDVANEVYEALWDKFPDAIRLLLENQYVFQPFWKHHNGIEGYENWEQQLKKSQTAANRALHEKNVTLVLSIVFDRLYVLRNQLIHGGATWNSSVNRYQVGDAVEILAFIIPIFLNMMMDNTDTSWGSPYYPVV